MHKLLGVKYAFIDKIHLSGKASEHVNFSLLRNRGWREYKPRSGPHIFFKKVKHVFLWINTKGYFGVRFCPGVVLRDDNSYYITLDEFEAAYKSAQRVFEEEIGKYIRVHVIENLSITRMDIAKNCILNNHRYSHACYLEVIKLLKKQSLPHCTRHDYKTGVMFRNKSKSVIIYIKSDEMLAKGHPNAHSIDNCYLRIEAQFKNSNAFLACLRKSENRKFSDWRIVFTELVKVLDKQIARLGLDQPFQSKQEVLEAAENSYARPASSNYVEYLEEINATTCDKHYTKPKKEQSQSYKNKMSSFRQKGVCPFWVELITGDQLCAMQNTYAAVTRKREKRERCKVISIMYFVIRRGICMSLFLSDYPVESQFWAKKGSQYLHGVPP